MNDFSLFSHRCLDPQLIIRDLPSAQRDWPLATSCTVMANSRLRNHARHTTPVPKYFLRKSVRLCTSRTSFERLFLFRFDRFFFDFFSTRFLAIRIYIYIYICICLVSLGIVLAGSYIIPVQLENDFKKKSIAIESRKTKASRVPVL